MAEIKIEEFVIEQFMHTEYCKKIMQTVAKKKLGN